MAKKIILPKQGLQMTEGVITAWLVREGEPVLKNQPLFEMETDKLTITIDAEVDGTLLKILRVAGETVPVAEIIAVVGDAGEDISAFLQVAPGEPRSQEQTQKRESTPAAQTQMSSDAGRIFISPRAKAKAEKMGLDYSALRGSGTDGLIIERDIEDETNIRITPLARREAESRGVALDHLTGSGPHGKIVREDVLQSFEQSKILHTLQPNILPMQGIRRAIAEKMRASLAKTAQATHRISVNMFEAGRVREIFLKTGSKLSYSALIAYAVCHALKEYPILNAELTPDGIWVKSEVNLGIAVALQNGLIVPVIANAGSLTLPKINETIQSLAKRAKAGALEPDECRGGSFTISNLGMYGLDSFTAILNPPESGILAVGAMIKKPIVTEQDEIVIRPMMEMTLTYDHQVVDGAPAAQFLARVKTYLEQPYLLL